MNQKTNSSESIPVNGLFNVEKNETGNGNTNGNGNGNIPFYIFLMINYVVIFFHYKI